MTNAELRDFILSQTDLKKEKITLFGKEMYVRETTAKERDIYERSMLDKEGKVKLPDNYKAKLLVKVIISKDGERIFKDTDVNILGNLSSKEMDRLFKLCQDLSGENEKAVKEAEKNS